MTATYATPQYPLQSQSEPLTDQLFDPPEAVNFSSALGENLQSLSTYSPLANGSRFSKADIKQSLKASTMDGTLSSVFESIVRGVLISNFLLGLGAGAFEIGLLSSIPMVAHLLQPLGAYFSEKTTSRHRYCLWIYGLSRVLWLLPAVGIFAFTHGRIDAHELTLLTMVVLALSNVLDSVGCASWMSWMAVLVPTQLRGRYFSLRRSLASLAALLTIPVGGWLVSGWLGGEIEGYGVVLIVAVLLGLGSLGFQFWMRDVNPQAEANDHRLSESENKLNNESEEDIVKSRSSKSRSSRLLETTSVLGDRNFLTLLLFLGIWTFGLNLSAPFFNFYLLSSLNIDVRWVTIYSSLIYGAFFLTIMLWGRIADRIGNRPVLMINGFLMAVLPLLWLYTDNSVLSLWLILPLLHSLQGGTVAALDLCLSNIQMELAPRAKQSNYFAIAAAVIGVTGALGVTVGSVLAELPSFDLPAIFVVSGLVRFASLVPLYFVHESRALPVRQLVQNQLQRLLGIIGQTLSPLLEAEATEETVWFKLESLGIRLR
ncbi:transporter, major facilitator family [Synechococcus sp. PCC 7335]|uniref:MFS transporter n=1 Tax=Synechococcus sp. (strain ATCC 29403 / PCC 7335) TaxID=91464 RepID=UPI00017EDFF2|nr:MFS transporter [Synechococcus sp. PCC 7335]EDX84557.1 transporter, major facilitator family [Synechococcus sp. PCC 7335]